MPETAGMRSKTSKRLLPVSATNRRSSMSTAIPRGNAHAGAAVAGDEAGTAEILLPENP